MALESPNADERRRGVVGLAEGSDGKRDWAVKVYDTLARTDPDAMVRCAALRALVPCDESPRVDTCIKLLRSAKEQFEGVREAPATVRWRAALLLGHAVRSGTFTDEERGRIVETLIDRGATEPDQNARLAMIETLGYFPERRVIESLIGTLESDNFTLQHAAEMSLAMLTGVTHNHDPDAWTAWYKSAADPFEKAGTMPPAALSKRGAKSHWDWLGWWE